jgi:DUF4097 and DUF4098 domain-containing protein YvlB
MRCNPAGIAAVVLTACGLVPRAFAEAPQLLATESTARIEITDEKVVNLVGLRGDTILHTGPAGELVFRCGTLDDAKAELPVAVWVDGSVVTLRAAEGQGNTPRSLDITLPPGFQINADTEDAKIFGASLDANVSVKGARVAVDIRGVNGDMTIDAQATTLHIESVSGATSIRARDTEITAAGITGTLSVRAVRGKLAISGARNFEGDLEAVTSKIENVDGSMHVAARGGQIVLTQARHGAELNLAGTTLDLERCEGDIAVDWDTSVTFRACKAALRFEGSGALTGEGNTGSVDVRTRGAAVALSGVTGATRVQGDALDVKLERIGGDVAVTTTTSQISVTDAQGPVTIDNDGGDISVQGTVAEVKVKSRGGDVKVAEAKGAVQIDADGRRVEVAWSGLSFQGKSDIRNESGAVVVRFPGGGGTRIEAESKFGQVESSLPTVVVTPDRHKAQGLMGYPGAAVVAIVAGGDVQLGGAAAPDAPADNDN